LKSSKTSISISREESIEFQYRTILASSQHCLDFILTVKILHINTYLSSLVHNLMTTQHGKDSRGFIAAAMSPSDDSPSVAIITHALCPFDRNLLSMARIDVITSRICRQRGVPKSIQTRLHIHKIIIAPSSSTTPQAHIYIYSTYHHWEILQVIY